MILGSEVTDQVIARQAKDDHIWMQERARERIQRSEDQLALESSKVGFYDWNVPEDSFTCTGSVGEALAAVERELPDLLLSDIGMPGDDGYTLIRKFRALPQAGHIRAAALTAYARAEDRRKALDAGYMMHIPKPVEPAELISVIASLTRFAPRKPVTD